MNATYWKIRAAFASSYPGFHHHSSLVTVCSHPRSGTHALATLIGDNFYSKKKLGLNNRVWGHWKNRQSDTDGFPYGLILGIHNFPSRGISRISYPTVYVYRDPRAVAFSLWKSTAFRAPEHAADTLCHYLRRHIDWIGSPGFAAHTCLTVGQHWALHVGLWLRYAKHNENILVVRYEDIIDQPDMLLSEVNERFFGGIVDLSQPVLDTSPTGLEPNKANVSAWREEFSSNDILFMRNEIERVGLKEVEGLYDYTH